MDDPRLSLIRSLRQRLEALGRSGLDRIPVAGASIPSPAMPEPVRAVSPAMPEPRPAPAARRPDPLTAPVSPHRPDPAPARPSAPVAPAAPGSLFGDDGFDRPPPPPAERPALLQVIAEEVAGCTRCANLAATRTQTVFGVGNPAARLMFIGEAPGADEDRQGIPFVGRAGQLLTDMITKGMGLSREGVYIANILKCRPPNNRDPEPVEATNCRGYLDRQIEIIRPEYLCCLGRVAAQNLLNTALPMGRLRGKWHQVRGIPTLVTYHPAALLRNPAWKADTWEDLKMLMRAMGLKVPDHKKGGSAPAPEA